MRDYGQVNPLRHSIDISGWRSLADWRTCRLPRLSASTAFKTAMLQMPTLVPSNGNDQSELDSFPNQGVCPRHELYFLRTGTSLDGRGSVRLLVDARAPYIVLAQESSPGICWDGPKYGAASSIAVTDLVRRRRDKEALQQGLAMLQECPRGIVTLAIRNGMSVDLAICPDPFLFVALYGHGKGCFIGDVSACAAVGKRLHPTLHIDWWDGVSTCEAPAGRRDGSSLDHGYASNTSDDQLSDDDVSEQEISGLRDPLEVSATTNFLVKNLLQRVSIVSSNATSPQSPKSVRSPASPKQAMKYAYQVTKKYVGGARFGRGSLHFTSDSAKSNFLAMP